MGNPSYAESNHASSKSSKEENGKPSISFRSRAAAPTAAQLHCLQYLIHELVSGGAPKKAGGFFSAVDSEIPSGNLRQFENFFNRLAFFPHILDYRGKYLKPLHFSKLHLGGPSENSCLITVNHHQRRISTGIIRELF
jgi:hypothetical protein